MEILGIGLPELLFILLIALIVMGPEDLSKTGKTLGRCMRNLVQSDIWKTWQTTTRELKTLPNRLMREANLEDLDLGKLKDTNTLGYWTSPKAPKYLLTPTSSKPPAETATPDPAKHEEQTKA